MKAIKAVFAVAVVFSFVAASESHGAVISVDSISAQWTNVVGGSDVTTNGLQSNPVPAEVRWGGIIPDNPLSAQSGYDFLSSAPPPFNVPDGVAFSLGTFTHYNYTIASGTGISSVGLDIFASIGGAGIAGPFQFLFDHTETTNSCSPAPTCADDIVSISNLTPSATFALGDQLYALTILGFSNDGGATISSIFTSPEGGMNSAELYAKFVAPVPLPAAVWMLIAALASLFGMSLFRRRAGA